MGVSSQDVVDALLLLVEEHNGKLSGSQLPRLYAKNSSFREIIDSAGGPKQFCVQNRELEFVTPLGGPGYIRLRADDVSAQDVVAELLALLDGHGGKLLAGDLARFFLDNMQHDGII